MAEITGVLGSFGISIASVIQHETAEEHQGSVPLVIMTHTATEGCMTQALEQIGKLGCVRPGSVRMRVRN